VTTAGPDADPGDDAGCVAVLFDMDGVLLAGRGTDPSVHRRALDEALAERGVDPDTETRSLLAGHEYDVDFVRGCRRLGVDPVALYGRRERYAAQLAIDHLTAGSRTLHDVAALDRLADHHPLGVVSNNYQDVVRFVVDHHRLDAFDHVRGRETGVGGFYNRKPNPHYLLEAMAELDAVDGLYVGDRGTDVLAATRAGLESAFVDRPHNADETLPVEPTLRVGSLAELVDRLHGDATSASRARADGS
jgi:HAD superfamily hydrolase (TIGR01549 family)